MTWGQCDVGMSRHGDLSILQRGFGAIIVIWGHLYVATSAFGVVGIWGHHCDLGSSLGFGVISLWGHHWDLGPSLGFGVISLWDHHWDLGPSLFGDIDLGSSPFGVIVIWGHHCDLGSSLCGDIRIWGHWDLGSCLGCGVVSL